MVVLAFSMVGFAQSTTAEKKMEPAQAQGVTTGGQKAPVGEKKMGSTEKAMIFTGKVVSVNDTDKTIVVKVERRFTHPLLKKTVRRSKNYHAHDENKTFKVGDTVSIEETKPISKLKKWTVIAPAKA